MSIDWYYSEMQRNSTGGDAGKRTGRYVPTGGGDNCYRQRGPLRTGSSAQNLKIFIHLTFRK